MRQQQQQVNTYYTNNLNKLNAPQIQVDNKEVGNMIQFLFHNREKDIIKHMKALNDANTKYQFYD